MTAVAKLRDLAASWRREADDMERAGVSPSTTLAIRANADELEATLSPAELGGVEAVEMSPEFTDAARSALLWVLWHHQGASSPVGQPLRFALGMGRFDELTDWHIRQAKRWDAFANASTPRAAERGEGA